MANATGSAANGLNDLDLDLHLGPPRHAAGLDLQLGLPRSDAGRGRDLNFHLNVGLDMERFAGSEVLVESIGDGARSGKVVSPVEMAPDPHAAGVPAMNPDDTVPVWVRRDLPDNQPLYYIGKKVLSKSDVNSPQARFLVPASAADRIPDLLTPYEIISAGFDRNYSQIQRFPGEKALPTRYPGVAVSVYVNNDKGWSMSDLNLRKFHRSDGTMINGMGYRRFMANCGMVVGDGIEIWAFGRSPYRLCFLMAKRDGVFPTRSSEAME